MITLAALQGRWSLERVIADRRAGVTGRLTGVADWVPDDAGLRQVEQGVLRYGDATPMQATRAYLWRAGPAGLEVFFDDGRPFHKLSATGGSDRHHCAPDLYDVRYDLSDWPMWSQVWTVTGPRKDATITSRFRPDTAP
jgi:hypothetical protein